MVLAAITFECKSALISVDGTLNSRVSISNISQPVAIYHMGWNPLTLGSLFKTIVHMPLGLFMKIIMTTHIYIWNGQRIA